MRSPLVLAAVALVAGASMSSLADDLELEHRRPERTEKAKAAPTRAQVIANIQREAISQLTKAIGELNALERDAAAASLGKQHGLGLASALDRIHVAPQGGLDNFRKGLRTARA